MGGLYVEKKNTKHLALHEIVLKMLPYSGQIKYIFEDKYAQ